jgi:hypothetical protein
LDAFLVRAEKMKTLTCGTVGMPVGMSGAVASKPLLKDFMKMRAEPDTYGLFCDMFLPNVVGKKKWSKQQENAEVDCIANDSDFAFGLVQLENGWDSWTKEIERREEAKRGGVGSGGAETPYPKRRKLEGKYTANACSAKKNCGWTNEGLRRYTAIFQEVKKDRERDSAEAGRVGKPTFGAWFLRCKTEAKGRNRKKQKGARVGPDPEAETIDIATCFSDDSAGVSSDDEGS